MPDDEPTRLRFTHLEVENWRNFTSVDIVLQRRAFLVGPNASGKSNLLDIFRFLRDLVAVGGGLQHAVEEREGVSNIRALAARRHSDIRIDISLGNTEKPRYWEYELCFNQDNRRIPRIKRERVRREGDLVLDRPDPEDKSDPERLTQTFLEQVNVNREFRSIAEFFRSVRYLHLVPQLVRDPDRSPGVEDDPFGGDFLEQVAAAQKRTRRARLRRAQEALKTAVPQLQELELTQDQRGTWHIRGKYDHWRPQGAWQTESQLSDGTLRLLGLLWAIQEGSGPLLLEEPELSLHTEVVRHLPQMFYKVQKRTGRQVILSTHSPEFLRDDGIGLDEVLVLAPEQEGTAVRLAGDIPGVRDLVQSGQSLADVIIPKTSPVGAEQLTLIDF